METNKTLETKVANYKLIAREALRMELISPRLSTIARIENDIADTHECKNKVNHEIKVELYELSKLDKEHPNFDKKKAYKEETLKNYEEEMKHYDEHLVEFEKQILEQREGIAKIESGETKVCLDSLNCLVEQMITKDALNQVK